MAAKEFEVGEVVVYKSHYHLRVTKITRITPTGIIRVAAFPAMSFNPNGRAKGDETGSIGYLTQEDRDRITRHKGVTLITKTHYNDISLGTINKIVKLINLDIESHK